MMFSDLSIGKTQDFKKYLNKYDVIHIDIQWFLANCEDKNRVVQFITKSVLDELREIYPECLVLQDGLLCLMRFQELKIKQDGENVSLFLSDEWDVLIRDEAQNQAVQENYINFAEGTV